MSGLHRQVAGQIGAVGFLLSGVRIANSRMVAAVIGSILSGLPGEIAERPPVADAIDAVRDASLRLLTAVNRSGEVDDERRSALRAVELLSAALRGGDTAAVSRDLQAA